MHHKVSTVAGQISVCFRETQHKTSVHRNIYTSTGQRVACKQRQLRQTHQVEHSQKSVDSIEMWLEQILTVHLRFVTYTDNTEKEEHTYIGGRGTGIKHGRRERERFFPHRPLV